MDPKLAARVAERFRSRTAAGLPPAFEKGGPPSEGMPPPPGAGPTRNIPKDHPFDPRALKPMAKALWASSVSLGHALAAYQHLNRLKSATISPDGMIGGRGYVMNIKDARQRLFNACEALSSIADTLFDEIQGPHWLPKLAQLDPNDAEDVSRFIEESDEILDNPEEAAEKNLDRIEKANDGPEKAKASDDEDGEDKDDESDEEDDEDEEGAEGDPEASKLPSEGTGKQASVSHGSDWIWTEARRRSLWVRKQARALQKELIKTAHLEMNRELEANSSLPVDSLPGPRVNDLDRGNQLGPYGSFNRDEVPSDNWAEGEKEFVYHYEGENDYRQAQSGLPADSTPTEGYDFGIGYGARGQGAGGYENPSGEGNGTKGVWGPQSGLPGSPSSSVGDAQPVVDVNLNERLASLLPGDDQDPVARSDYFPGWKGNLVQAEAGLPQDVTAPTEQSVSVMDTGYVQEDTTTPYARYDYTTPSYRDDPLHTPSEG